MSLQALSEHYAALWTVLRQDGARLREREEVRRLADRVRDALDRHLDTICEREPQFIANSFAIEETLYQSERTEVHRIRHRDLEVCYALKTLPVARSGDAIARELLLREARFSMSVLHPNVVVTHMPLRLPDGRPALVAGLMQESLNERIRTAPLRSSDILDLMRAVLGGLAALHAANIVHCDIAPDNILFGCPGFAEAKLSDFGIALRSGESHKDLDVSVAGREAFAAPEQVAGRAVDARSDLYACGRLLELLLAQCPDEPPASFGRAADALLKADPDERPATAAQVLDMLVHPASSR